MTKAETERHLRGIYFEWIRENRDTHSKGIILPWLHLSPPKFFNI